MDHKKYLAGAVAMAITLSSFPAGAVMTNAVEILPEPQRSAAVTAGGEWSCGENIVLTIKDGVATLALKDETAEKKDVVATSKYAAPEDRPWNDAIEEIETLIISDGITHINSNMFCGASNLKKIVFGKDVVSIGTGVFMLCPALETVTLPKSVKYLFTGSFYSVSLKTVYYEGTEEEWSKVTVKDGAFIEDRIPEIICSTPKMDLGRGLNAYIDDAGTLHVEGSGSIDSFEKGKSPLAEYADEIKSIALAPGITAIGDYAFEDLTTVSSIPLDGITSVGKGAFAGCTGVKSLMIPDSLRTIGADAFGGADHEIYVIAGSAGEKYAKDSGVEYTVVDGICGGGAGYTVNNEKTELTVVGTGDMYSWTEDKPGERPWNDLIGSIEKVRLSDGITSAGSFAFSGADKLKSVILPDSLRTVGAHAFSNCHALTWVYIPEGVTSFDRSAFYNDDAVTYIAYPESAGYQGDKGFDTAVGAEAEKVFYKGDKSAYTGVPKDVSDKAVFGCDTGVLGEDHAWAYDPDEKALTVFGSGAMAPCEEGKAPWTDYASETEDIILADSVTAVGDNAFAGFTSVKTLDLGSNVEEVGSGSFRDCTGLTDVEFSEGLTSIGDSAFEGCTGITETEFPESLKTVGDSAFRNCTGLSSVKLPKEASSVGAHAFEGCTSLKDVFIRSATAEIGDKAFGFQSDERKTPGFSMVTYSGTPAAKYAEESGINSVTAEGSCGESAVWAFDEESGVLFIYGSGDTYDYTTASPAPWAQAPEDGEAIVGKIKEVRFDSGITSVGNAFLSGAGKLVKVSLPDSLTHIGSSAFLGCTDLERVLIPAEVTEIGISAFQKCDNLRTIIFEGSHPEITGAVIASQKKLTSTKNMTVYYHGSDESWAEFAAGNGSTLGFHSSTTLRDLDKESTSDKIILTGAPSEIAIGDQIRVGVELDPRIATEFDWESSSPEIIQVSAKGDVTAYAAGTASITVRAAGAEDISASFLVKASDKNGYHSRKPETVLLEGAISNNISNNDYATPASKPLTSHIMQREDGGLTIIEANDKEGRQDALIQEYDKDNKLIRSLTIENPFVSPSFFIGFYNGAKYNFLVFCQENPEEDDEKEIVRIVRYNKDWTEPLACSIKDIGATGIGYKLARMAETDKYLYFVSNRLEYFSLYPGEVAQHQSNLVYAIDLETMERDEAGIAALVSHSFNQFISIDDEHVFTADHGDISPRSIIQYRFNRNVTSTTNMRSVTALDIVVKGHGMHQNDTGVSIGGLEATGSGCLMVGNSVLQTPETETSAQRNIFVTVTDKDFTEAKLIWLTDHPEGSSITPRTPQLVRVSSNVYTVMWEELDNDTGLITTKYMAIDQYGEKLTEVKSTDLRLSDCQPIMTAEGDVVWYVTENSKPVLYKVNPYSAEAIVTNEVKYDFDEETGTLTVSGKGSIPDYKNPEGRPYDEYKEKIKKVVVEGDIYTIGDHAFSDLGSVEEIYVESDTFAIGDDAFRNNKELTVLVLPDNVNSMGKEIITGNDKLELIVLPDSIDKADIGEIYSKPDTEVFYNGTQEQWEELTKDTPDETRAKKEIKTGAKSGKCGETAYWVYDPATKELEVYGSGEIETKPDGEYPWSGIAGEAEKLDIQDGITVIPDKAFADFSKMTEIVIPETVEKIGEAAFAGNDASTFVIIPDSVKEISSSAFGTDSDLNPREDFTIYGLKDSAAQKYAEEQNTGFIEIDGKCGDNAAYIINENTGKLTIVGTGDMYDYKEEALPPWYEEKDKIKKAEIEDGITRIGNYSLWCLDHLKEVTIPFTVQEVGKRAVTDDPELVTINIETVDFTEEFASFFNDYGTERTINFSGSEEQWNAMSHEHIGKEPDKVVFDYVAPPEPPETTTEEPQTGQNTETTTTPDPSQGTTGGDGTTDPSQGTTSGDGTTDPSQGTTSGEGTSDPSQGTTSGEGTSDPSQGTTGGDGTTDPSQGTTGGDGTSEPSQTTAGSGENDPTHTEPAGDYLLGDVNRDGTVDSNDASELLSMYAQMSTGGEAISEETLKIADVNFDGMADSSDASLILEYYAYISTGGDKKSNDYFNDVK